MKSVSIHKYVHRGGIHSVSVCIAIDRGGIVTNNIARRLPRTYPLGTYPIFTIKPPIVGLRPQELSKLTHAIHEKAQAKKGEQMVFEVSMGPICAFDIPDYFTIIDHMLRQGVDGGTYHTPY